MGSKNEFVGVGRRKSAVVSVRLRQGSGKIDVNNRKFSDYFYSELQHKTILSPLQEFDLLGKYDIVIRAKGGGIEGQMIAARLAIARALVKEKEQRRMNLKSKGYLTRDPRKKERKKYGLAGARKSFQFSKR